MSIFIRAKSRQTTFVLFSHVSVSILQDFIAKSNGRNDRRCPHSDLSAVCDSNLKFRVTFYRASCALLSNQLQMQYNIASPVYS